MAMFPVLDLAGGASERGRMHGALAKRRVDLSIANYRSLFEHCGIGWSEAQRLGHSYRDVIGDFAPSLLAEIEGIATGAGRALDEILALNARTEILPPTFPGKPGAEWLASRLGAPADFGECTAIAVSPSRSTGGETLLAQNWDWLGAQRDALLVLRGRGEGGMNYLTLTEAGMLAKIGCNDRGFGVCLNILRSADDGAAPGVPVHVLLRALLDCGSVHEALERVRALRFGASSNVLCADRGGDSAALELSPAGAHVVRGADGALCHTNHFLAAQAQRDEVALPPSLSSVPRLACALRHAQGARTHDLRSIQRLLRDETDGLLSVCRHPDPSLPEEARVETVASVIMELARGVMHVAPDVPSRAEYVPVALAAEAVAA
jgi:isopenicillin-N N-acyltransferase-like protein